MQQHSSSSHRTIAPLSIPAPAPVTAEYGALLLRISLAAMWISHALLKLLVFSLPGTAKYFESVGFPGMLAYPVFALEVAGGIALFLGVYARQVALALTPLLLAAASVHFGNGWVHTSAGGGWEYPVFLAVASLVLWLVGDGAYALARSQRLTPASASASTWGHA